ncbi:MAG: transglycosylase SLT domain-containing protein [Bdellovibrionales bacterium]
MQDLTNIIQNSGLASITQGASKGVLNAIGAASAKSGVDFAYLVQQAQAESNFNPTVKASSSSATGLFQFIKSTWTEMIDKYGAKHGVDTDGMSQQEILDLRKDPTIASNMAAEFASENERFLERHWDASAKGEKEIGATELYFAHFMGAGGAASFLNARDENGMKTAAALFPSAAKANPNVFYEKGTGRARSLDEVYAFFDKKFQVPEIDGKKIMIDNIIQLAEDSIGGSNVPPIKTDSERYNSLVFKGEAPNYYSPLPNFQLVQSPIELMLLSQMELPSVDLLTDEQNSNRRNHRNSIFYDG